MSSAGWLVAAIFSLAMTLALLVERLLRRRREARAYLKGVRYVLSDDPDAAIAALSDAARLGSPEAVETYLALGALFRRTGDLARAIRLHRNMLLGPWLDVQGRAEVELELARDYRRSGLLDEALAVYRERAAAGDPRAREGVRDVLIDLGHLSEAAEVQRELVGGVDPVLAHLLAAEARTELAQPARACATARAAVAADPGSADAHIALAEALGAAGEVERALAEIALGLDLDPDVTLLAWPALAGVPDPDAALRFIEGRLSRASKEAALYCLRGHMLYRMGREREASAILREALALDGSGEIAIAIRELLAEVGAPSPAELAARHDLVLAAFLLRSPPLRCGRCGAEVPMRTWRCPWCGAWGGIVRKAPQQEAL